MSHSDLVKRLRASASDASLGVGQFWNLCDEAADALEDLDIKLTAARACCEVLAEVRVSDDVNMMMATWLRAEDGSRGVIWQTDGLGSIYDVGLLRPGGKLETVEGLRHQRAEERAVIEAARHETACEREAHAAHNESPPSPPRCIRSIDELDRARIARRSSVDALDGEQP